MKNFEDYLQTMHGEQYEGIDDDMPEDFNRWLEQFDVNDILQMVKDYEWNYSHTAGKGKDYSVEVNQVIKKGLGI